MAPLYQACILRTLARTLDMLGMGRMRGVCVRVRVCAYVVALFGS